MEFDCRLTDAMVKVFPDQAPPTLNWQNRMALVGQPLHLQLVYRLQTPITKAPLKVTVTPKASMHTVALVPSSLPTWPNPDAHYLATQPGLFPDRLEPSDGTVQALYGQYRSLWLSIDTSTLAPGEQPITVTATDLDTDLEVFSQTLTVTLVQAPLQPASVHHTEWFYVDCLADYYHLKAYSPELWQVIGHFLDFAHREAGVDTILTPIFTPPLDTKEGSERTNVQLLDITVAGDTYQFGWTKLRQWCEACRHAGIANLELPPLFTQWGARFTPNIYQTDGKRLFGWDVAATDPAYRRFLAQLIPQLLKELAACGYDQAHLFFHIADEPNKDTMGTYAKARSQVIDLLDGLTVIDALSDHELYEEGYVQTPVVADDAMGPFLANHDQPIWAYYCCAQTELVPNRFFALPSYRNRVHGVLMYRHQVKGFLHWGFNFYNRQLSTGLIDPYLVTDAGEVFPSGDPFLVYPGADGRPVNSLRNVVQMMGFADVAALESLERLSDRQTVTALIDQYAGSVPTFAAYPQAADWLDDLMQAVYQQLQVRQ